MSEKKKVVLAYSGGLDTSVAVKWLQDQGYDVVTFTADVGQSVVDLEGVKEKAEKTGACSIYVMDLRKDFVEKFVWPSLKANAMYQGTYPLNSALSRPLIAKYLAWIAKLEGAVAVAHGCTGKGQDQVRIEVCVNALDPDLRFLLRCGTGIFPGKPKLNTRNSIISPCRIICRKFTASTRTCGDAPSNAAFSKIPGTNLPQTLSK